MLQLNITKTQYSQISKLIKKKKKNNSQLPMMMNRDGWGLLKGTSLPTKLIPFCGN